MKNPPPPLHSRYPPRKLLLFLLSNTHPAIGVMGNKNTTTLINGTEETMEIREFRGIYVDENQFFSKITVKDGKKKDIDATKYGGEDSQGGQLPYLMIFCGGSLLSLRSSEGDDLLLRGEEFISLKTVTIEKQKDQNSTGVVNYKVEFQPRDASIVSTKSLKALTLDPSKLFASNIVDDPEASLLRMVLKFWPRTFAYLNRNDDLGRNVGVVNDLMRQAKLYNVDRSKVKVAKVEEKVRVLNELCVDKVEWYRPLFPGMENQFPPVAETMVEVDHAKLKKFATTIEPLLRQPNSLQGAAESHDQFS